MAKKYPSGFMTEREIVQLARDQIGYGRTQGDLAEEANVSKAYVSGFLAGKKGIGPALLSALGFDTTRYYKRVRK